MEKFIVHYGVKGMKWGVRKERYRRIYKSRNQYAIKDEKGNIISKLKFYDYKIKNFDWVLVSDVDTKKEYRGQGLATNLLNRLYKDVSNSSGKGLYMFVRKNNENAIRLYSKLDFKKVKDYKLPDGDYVIMAKGKPKKSQFDKMNFA